MSQLRDDAYDGLEPMPEDEIRDATPALNAADARTIAEVKIAERVEQDLDVKAERERRRETSLQEAADRWYVNTLDTILYAAREGKVAIELATHYVNSDDHQVYLRVAQMLQALGYKTTMPVDRSTDRPTTALVVEW